MCIFCAAIPATAALGAAAQGKRAEARRRATAEPTTLESAGANARPPALPDRLPIAAITGVVIAGLIVGSAVTHITTSG